MSQKKVSLDYPYEASNFRRSGLADWLELYLHDHGFLRLAFQNLYQIDNYMWRSNQPSPKQIEHAHNKFGIKTILNLRGPRVSGGWQLEAEVCDKLNINLNPNEYEGWYDLSKSNDGNAYHTVWLKNIDRLMNIIPLEINISQYHFYDVGCGLGISTLYFCLLYTSPSPRD